MARLSICSECEHIVYELPESENYVILDEDDRVLMHASCYELRFAREDREMESLLGERKTVSTEAVAKKKRRMPPDRS